MGVNKDELTKPRSNEDQDKSRRRQTKPSIDDDKVMDRRSQDQSKGVRKTKIWINEDRSKELAKTKARDNEDIAKVNESQSSCQA